MGFQSVNFHGFRNLEDGEVNLGAHDIYLIGENGQGKTNFLEALYLLSYGSSFRTRQDRDLVAWNTGEMAVQGRFDTVEEPNGRLSVSWRDGVKTIKLHGKTISDRKELLRRIPVIVFAHEDFLFSGGPPERRRWFMDQTLSLHDPLYVDQMRRFKKILKERNHLLRTRKTELLEHYGEQLAFAGLAVSERRNSLTREFGRIFTSLFKEVSGISEDINLVYRPSWGDARSTSEVMEKLKEKREIDLTLGTTGSGPHRDRFQFICKNRDFAKSASTGQQRLLSLVLRVAQARFYSETTGRKPLLLLDDVLLELDPNRRRLFRDRLPEAEQVFYTFLPGEETGRIGEDSLTYELKEGQLHERR
ncbi:MAG: DNA replication/repair protein RecF [Spirochaetaceae bacterium]|nr:DNA replication/repair protein RecF [Spirochaetaceae bacterium]